MKAIILSAGQGRRLMPMTESIPKCCLMLEGTTLLGHQVDALMANGIDDIVVVTGYAHQVVDEVIRSFHKASIRTLYNPFYALSDNLGTSWIARNEMKEPFLLINGDTLFEASTLSQLLSGQQSYPITLAIDHKEDYDSDDMKVSTAGNRLKRVGKKLDMGIVNGESIGMMVFDQSGADAFVRKIESLMRGPNGLIRWYLSAIDELAMDGTVGTCSIHGLGWCEVDDLKDFAHAESAVRTWLHTAVNPGVHQTGNSNIVSGPSSRG
jgi:choline kinase